MSDAMAELIAKKFIQRRDVKAMQTASGAYIPVTEYKDGPRIPWRMRDLQAHLAGEVSYGHYLLDADDKCKLFAFDIDIEKMKKDTDGNPTWWGSYPTFPDMTNYPGAPGGEDEYFRANTVVTGFDPYAAWRDRAHPGRKWLKYQMRMIADTLARIIYEELQLPVAVAYSGNKGLHVYGFTGTTSAAEVREAADTVLALAGCFEPLKGKNFFRHTNSDPIEGFPNLSVEVFPKQISLEGKDLGNLMRLPLGKNIKSNDPTFFVDQRLPMTHLLPHPDPVALLEGGNPWE